MINRFYRSIGFIVFLFFLFSGCSQKSPPQTLLEYDDNFSPTSASVDGFRLSSGMFAEEVKLDSERQVYLINLILTHPLQETTPENLAGNDVLYGGSIITLEYTEKNISYKWSFTANIIAKNIINNDGIVETHYYQADQSLLNQLEKFI